MTEYYVKMCQEHPLVVYLEDPCADTDIDGYKKLRECLQESNLQHVQIGMKNYFRDSTLQKVQELTSVKHLSEEEEKKFAEENQK